MKAAIILLICLLFSLMKAKPDDNVTASLRLAQFVQNAHTYSRLNPQEKVYLHFDNTGYFGGETIWFKAYVVAAKNNIPTDLSGILYVEFLAPDGKIIDERKLKIENGQCHGEFILDRLIYPGYYEIRAYTRYMLNFEEDLIFSRVFPILNPDYPEEIELEVKDEVGNQDVNSPFLDKMRKELQPPKKEQLIIHFYPEGGNLIQGIPTKVAFKAINEQGKSVEIEGSLFNPKKETVQLIKTFHQGMGIFEFTPDAEGYYIEVLQGKKKHKFELPAILPIGYVMTLNRANEEEQEIILQKTGGLSPDTLGLAITCRGNIVYFETVYNDAFPLNLKIADENLPEGVNRLILFDSKGEIFADRLFFINKDQTHTLTVSTNKQSYLPYEKITMDLHLPDTRTTPFSLAIRDGSREPEHSYDNIRSNLLLSSELKGYIETPGYYFEKQDEERAQALDLLMRVQGWRRYSWEETIVNKEQDWKHYIEKEILVKGKILSKEDNLPLAGVELTVRIADTDSTMRQGRYLTDQYGNFVFRERDFEGRKDMLFIIDKDSMPIDAKITLDRQISPKARSYSFPEIIQSRLFKPSFPDPDSDMRSFLETMQHLSEVTIKTKKIRRPIIYNVDKEVTYYRDLGLDMPYWSGHTYMQHRNKHYAHGDTDNLSTPYKGTPGAVIGFSQLGIWKNETTETVEEKNIDIFTFRKIEEIARIDIVFEGEVIRNFKKNYPKSFRKNYILIGVCPFEKPIEAFIGTRFTYLQGYSQREAFQQPDYENSLPVQGEIDYHRTLYWNPNVQPNEQGNVSIDFYNNSSCRELVISAEGIDQEGKIIQHLIRKEVKELMKN